MKIESGKRNDFFGYLTPLRLLEQMFQAVNRKIDITLRVEEEHGDKFKWVEIKRKDDRFLYNERPYLINHSTPEELIRDVARFLGERPPKKEKKNG